MIRQPKFNNLPIVIDAKTGLTIAVQAGAAGTVKQIHLGNAPILDSTSTAIGIKGDTSLVFTSTTFDNEVDAYTPDSSLANGDYWVDYTNGILRGKKKDTGTSLTSVAYVTYKLNVLTA
jgi:hypothetical protein